MEAGLAIYFFFGRFLGIDLGARNSALHLYNSPTASSQWSRARLSI